MAKNRGVIACAVFLGIFVVILVTAISVSRYSKEKGFPTHLLFAGYSLYVAVHTHGDPPYFGGLPLYCCYEDSVSSEDSVKLCEKCSYNEFYSKNPTLGYTDDFKETINRYFSQGAEYQGGKDMFDTICPSWSLGFEGLPTPKYFNLWCSAKKVDSFPVCNGNNTSCGTTSIVNSMFEEQEYGYADRINYFFTPCPSVKLFENYSQIESTCDRDVPLVMMGSFSPECAMYKSKKCEECLPLTSDDQSRSDLSCFCAGDKQQLKDNFGDSGEFCVYDASNPTTVNSLYLMGYNPLYNHFIDTIGLFCKNSGMKMVVYNMNRVPKVGNYTVDLLITCQ